MRRLVPRLLFTLALLAFVGAPRPAAAEKVYGALLIDGARKVEQGRYRSPKNFERTVRFFRRTYGRTKGVVFRRMATTPKVKGVHIANLRSKRTWEGINVYEVKDRVFIYVIKASPDGAEKK